MDISAYTQTIIFNSSTALLEPYFLPVSQRLKLKCDDFYAQELSLKHATRLESSDREDLESNLGKVNYCNFIALHTYLSFTELRNSRSRSLCLRSTSHQIC